METQFSGPYATSSGAVSRLCLYRHNVVLRTPAGVVGVVGATQHGKVNDRLCSVSPPIRPECYRDVAPEQKLKSCRDA